LEQPRSERDSATGRLLALGGPAYLLALRILGSREAAEDAVQVAYLNAWKWLQSRNPPDDERAWFLRTVANAARSTRRADRARARREKLMPAAPAQAHEPRPDPETVETLRSALGKLDEKYRLPVSLCCEQGLSQREAAAVLEMPESTVSKYVRVGLEKLRKAMTGTAGATAPAALLEGLKHTPEVVSPGLLAAAESIMRTGALPAGLKAAGTAASAASGAAALAWKLLAGALAAGLLGLGAWKLDIGGPGEADPKVQPAAGPRPSALEKPVALRMRTARPRAVLAAIHRQTGLRWTVPPLCFYQLPDVDVVIEKGKAREALDAVAAASGMKWKPAAGTDDVVLFNLEDPGLDEVFAEIDRCIRLKLPRESAFNTLLYSDDMRALPRLVRYMKSEKLWVRRAAAGVLRHFLIAVDQNSWRYGGYARSAAGHWLDAPSRKKLVGALLDPKSLPPETRRSGFVPSTRLRLLGCLDDDPRAAAEILKCLKSEDRRTVYSALSAAAISGNPHYEKHLLRMARKARDSQRQLDAWDLKLGKTPVERYRALSRLAPKEKARRRELSILASTHFIERALRNSASEKAREAWAEFAPRKFERRGRLDLYRLSHVALGTFKQRVLPVIFRRLEDKSVRNPAEDETACLAALSGTELAPEISKRLVKLLETNPRRRAHILETLAKLGEPEGQKALIGALGDEDFETRLAALGALAHSRRKQNGWSSRKEAEAALLGIGKAIDRVREQKDRNWHVYRLVVLLGEVGSERSVTFLSKLVMEAGEGERSAAGAAMVALVSISGPEAAAALRDAAARAKDRRVRQAAALFVLRLVPQADAARKIPALVADWKPVPANWPALYGTPYLLKEAEELAARGGEPMAAALLEMSKHAKPHVRAIAARAMAKCRDHDFSEQLSSLLRDRVEMVRIAARQALQRLLLGRRRHERVAMLKRMFANEGGSARLAALSAQAQSGLVHVPLKVYDRKTVGWMLGKLSSADTTERWLAVNCLSGLTDLDPRIAPALEKQRKLQPGDFHHRPPGQRGKPGRRPRPRHRPEPPEVF